jgi:small subunit ribosomal protein SAe
MESYIYRRSKDGVHYLDLAKTWEKLMIAARIIAQVQRGNPQDVLVSIGLISTRHFKSRC